MPGRKVVTQCTDKEWKAIIDRIRSSCPPPEGYDWRFTRSSALERDNKRGDCDRREPKDGKRGTIIIRVQRGMSESETADIVIHEVAHSYDMWTHHSWAGDHSDTFWLWVGRVYRRYWGEP